MLCLVGFICITYGLTRWLVTKGIIEWQLAHVKEFVMSQNIELVSVKLTDDPNVIERKIKPTSEILGRISRPGYPDYWQPGAVALSVVGVLFIIGGCYFQFKTSEDQSVPVRGNLRFVLTAILLGLAVLFLTFFTLNRFLFSSLQSVF